MDKLDQFFEEWSSVLHDIEAPSEIISNQQNKSIMENFINYEQKVKKGRKQAMLILFSLAGVILAALLLYSLLTYFRGSEAVSYDLAEMIIGCFLMFMGCGAMIINLKKIKFPSINALPTSEYLSKLKYHLLAWQKREIPAIVLYTLFVPAGIALFLKSVFEIPFVYLFIPMFLLYVAFVIMGFRKNNPEFKSILSEINVLEHELHTDF